MRSLLPVGVFAVTFAFATAAEPTADQLEFFEKTIRPILIERCYKCHSAQAEKLKGGLRLDSLEGILQGGDGGPVITPAVPERSKLIEAIGYQNPDLQMPPKGQLPRDQIVALTAWVRTGAPWPKEEARNSAAGAGVFDLEKRRREHWAWQPIKPERSPVVEDAHWAVTPVDNFILARLERAGLRPAPPTDQRVLLRRLYFDLIGLPPTPQQLEDYLRDPSPAAYEKEVDRLLASPHFGERWARHWLDLVRYAETLGHEFDYPVQNAWRYRDYVIRAFNADVPYDQFVVEHIAGDLLTNARRHPSERFNESVIGTGFFWLGQRDHSPVDVRQHQAELIDNQIDVMCKTFLGLTVACARCHDHKFDAISTKDFYALYGVLESSRYAQRAINPVERLAPRLEQLQGLKKEIRRAAIAEWSKQDISKYLLPATNSQATELLTRWPKVLGDKALADPAHPLYPWLKLSAIGSPSTEGLGQKWDALMQETAASSQEGDFEFYARARGGRFDGWFADGEAFSPAAGGTGDFIVGDTNRPLIILHGPAVNSAAISRRLEGSLRSPTFEIKHPWLHIRAAGRATRARVCVENLTMIREPIYGGLMKYPDSDQPAWLSFDLARWKGCHAYIELNDLTTPDPADDSQKNGYGLMGFISAECVVFSERAAPPAQTDAPAWLALLGPERPRSLEDLATRYQKALKQALRIWDSKQSDFTAEEEVQLSFLAWLVQSELLGEPEPGLQALLAKYRELESAIPKSVMVPAMADGNGVDEHVFIRGNHKTLGEVAPRQFLAALSDRDSSSFKRGSGRLELAHCMTDSSNPLLARVMVNRAWLHLFGRGIVPTPDDFGALGQRPSHPELLDWLANWYRSEGAWSTKKLIRLLVMSSAYRMSSRPADVVAEEKDPDNLLFHRMPLKRLEGEIIRDSMLAISGRLDEKMFGPPVPAHLTEFMDGRGRPDKNGPEDGDGRRSIYLDVRRNFLSPMMRAFDTPVPATTIGKRTVSNVPAQSLILLNDPFVLDQAALWAKLLLREKDRSPQERIRQIYLMAFGRPPGASEEAAALAFLQQQGAGYGLSSLAGWQDERVWSDLCHVSFSVKEFIFVE